MGGKGCMKKRAAMEMSIGTIVVVVLAMSMLILGLVLIKTIFTGANDVSKMTTDQIKNQVAGMFGEDKKLVVYPDTRIIDAKAGEISQFGIGIKNLLQGSNPETTFTYEVKVSDADIQKKCGVDATTAESWITTGRTDTLKIAPGDIGSGVVRIEIPAGSSLCTFRYRVNVNAGTSTYATELMDVAITA